MAQFTLNHHPGLDLAAYAEYLAESWILPSMHLAIHRTRFSRCRLGRHSWLIIYDIEAVQVALENILHMGLQNMQRGIRLPEKLFALTHPVLMSLLLLLEV